MLYLFAILAFAVVLAPMILGAFGGALLLRDEYTERHTSRRLG